MSEETIVNCPTCQKPVVWGEQSPYRPFCSKRCADIDLGNWFNENYRFEAENIDEQDLEELAKQTECSDKE